MEFKLVYRGLRQVSDWVLRFYSEIYVDGEENVRPDGPLIIASCHHNEILDIATLSVTIPHGRPVCFWAKSTMFKNPLVRQILLSSGSIPVARNPNSTPVSGADPSAKNGAHDALFRDTFKALERGEVIGVFPEGTSYTEPSIAQVKDGASRAALEYVRWLEENGKSKDQEKKLQIVPVGIVYTDKSQYRSRVCVRWGTPIGVEAFVQEKLSQDGSLTVDSREMIKALTAEIEQQMLKLTVNAPDWDTLYATQMARDILWAEEEIPSSHFVWINQNLIDLFADPNAAASGAKARQSLLKYHSLLCNSRISHSSLNAILPSPTTASANSQPSRIRGLYIFIRESLLTVLHPRFALFLPTLLLHAPAYLTGFLADRLLAKRDEEEGRAQFKAVFGGLAATAAYAAVTRRIVRALVGGAFKFETRWKFVGEVAKVCLLGGQWLFTGGDGWDGKARAALGVCGIFYATSFVLSRWHNYWVGSNYTQFGRLSASWKLFTGILAPRWCSVSGTRLAQYTVPYVPPPNPYIKRREAASGTSESTHQPHPPCVLGARLVPALLDARDEATRNLWSFMVDSKYLHGLVTARVKGEAWMQVGPAKRHEYELN